MKGVDRDTGEQLDDVNIRYQITTFLIAGHETTSGLLSSSLYALVKHPDVLAKAYEEVDRVLGADIEAKPTYQNVSQLTYIQQILKEALRLWPPAPALHRAAEGRDDRRQIRFEEGRLRFRPHLGAASRSAVWGPHPDASTPTISPARRRPSGRTAWKPFGNGQRACIGRGFAMHEAALALGMILQRFKLIDIPLSAGSEGDADDQARRVQDQGAAANRSRPHRAVSEIAAGTTLRPRPRRGRGRVPATTHRCWCSMAPISALRRSSRSASPISPRSTVSRPGSRRSTRSPASCRLKAPCSYSARRTTARRPTTPRNSSTGSAVISRTMPSRASRYAVFGCGNTDWTATYQSIPRLIDDRLAEDPGARSIYARGEGDAKVDLDGQFESWFAALGTAAVKEFRARYEFQRVDDAPLYSVEPVAPGAVNAIAALGGAAPMKLLVNRELQDKTGPNARTVRPGISRFNCRPASAIASAIVRAWCRATIRRWWTGLRAASASCRPTRSGSRSRKAVARNCRPASRCRSDACSPISSSCSRPRPASRSSP